LVLFLFTSFTGYFLPNAMPRKLTPLETASALRFVILHAVLSPIAATLTLATVLWQHARPEQRAGSSAA
jgi:hypothetical protein